MKPDPNLEPVRVVNGNELYVRSSPGAYWFSRTDKGGYFHKAFILGGNFSGESSADHIAQKIWVGYSYELVHRALLELGWHDVDTLYAERRRAAETHADRERALQAEKAAFRPSETEIRAARIAELKSEIAYLGPLWRDHRDKNYDGWRKILGDRLSASPNYDPENVSVRHLHFNALGHLKAVAGYPGLLEELAKLEAQGGRAASDF